MHTLKSINPGGVSKSVWSELRSFTHFQSKARKGVDTTAPLTDEKFTNFKAPAILSDLTVWRHKGTRERGDGAFSNINLHHTGTTWVNIWHDSRAGSTGSLCPLRTLSGKESPRGINKGLLSFIRKKKKKKGKVLPSEA